MTALFCTFPPTNLADMRALAGCRSRSTGFSQLFGLGPARAASARRNARGCFDVADRRMERRHDGQPRAATCRQMIRNQEHGVWDRSAVFQREIRGRTVGLWGYGGIGRETARLAKAMGMRSTC